MSSENGSDAATVPIAIIGIGCLFPKAGDARAYWLNIKNGVDSIGPVPVTHWNPDDYLDSDPKSPDRTYAARGGFLDAVDFRPLDFGIAPNDLEATDTSQLLGLVAAKQALADAGYDSQRNFDRDRVSVILGVTGTLELVIPLGARLGHPRWRKALAEAGVPLEKAEGIIQTISDSYVGWQENSFPGLLGNVVAGRIANRLDLGGTNCVVDAACASSLSAIHLAGLELASGRSDLAVTGGVDTFNDIFMFMCFSKTPALSPSGDAKPFDAKSDGTILGEGLGIVVLKRLADAERDGDRVYAVIKGLGSSSDGKGNAIYAPSAAGQKKALRNAYELAGVTPDTIELVEGHGTGTRVGDTVEATALSEVYREAKKDGTWCALGSVKSQIGHTKAAAGAAGLIKAALALHHNVLPPTIKVKEPVEALRSENSPIYVNTEKRPWIANPDHPRRAAVSAFGFGGSNFHCVLEEHRAATPEIDWESDVEIIALSAANPAALSKELEPLKVSRSWNETQRLAAESRASFSPANHSRLLFVINRDSTDLPKLAESARTKLIAEPESRFWRIPEGAYYGSGPVPGRLAVLFPGQGSQYVGMLRDLSCQFPIMRDVLADANRVFKRIAGDAIADRLSDLIYPHPAFSKDERERQERRLRETQVAQPAIGAVSLGALKIFEEFGLTPDAYAGHSYGELPALCAAGCFDEEALHTMSRLRGHLMASYHGGDAGSMLAVHAPVNAIESILREESLDLVIANRNAPLQSVLSGRGAEIDRAIISLDRRQLHHTRLPVAAAFHSPLVASAREPFAQALGELEFRRASKQVFANTTGQLYPTSPQATREQLAEQLARPVDFVREISGMFEGGIRTFLEVGPGSTITKLVTAILSAPEKANTGWDAFALDASAGKRSGTIDLAHALVRLAAHGHSVDLKRWQDSGAPAMEAPKPGLVVPICGANYIQPKSKKSSVNTTTIDVIRQPDAPARSTIPAPTVSPKTMQEPIAIRPLAAPTTNGSDLTPSPIPNALSQALQITQQSLGAFQKLQEQTARLHKQFLENQEAAQRTLQILVEQQHALLTGAPMPATRFTPLVVAPPRRETVLPLPTPSPTRNGDVPKAPVVQDQRPREMPVPAPVPTSPQIDVSAILTAVVAEKTGYPAEMLTPEMALDADLGIDSIKRVEIFSTIQERLPNAPVVGPEHLGTLHSLRDVIEFLSSGTVVITPTPPVSVAADSSRVQSVLFAVVAEKTGYPPEMLNAEMALDADLGIDSIKRVEIFSALQERLPEAPVVKPEHLGSLHSLGEIIAFLSGNEASAIRIEMNSASTSAVSQEVRIAPVAEAIIERSVLRTVPLNRATAGPEVHLPSGSTIVLVANNSTFVPELLSRIERDGCRVRLVSWADSPESVDASNVSGLILVTPDKGRIEDLPLRAFRWLRHVRPGLKRSAQQGGAFVGTISQFDGAFGLNNLEPQRDARQGALAGLAKTAALEWPEVACKAIDLDPTAPPRDLAKSAWEEMRLRGPAEVGISAKDRVTLELRQEAIGELGAVLSSSDIVVITGGARGVTAAVAVEIARRFRPTLVLFGRTEIESTEPDWLRGCETEAAIKQALSRQLPPPASPKKIEAEYRRIAGQREAAHNIAEMRKAGARVVYKTIDITQPAAVENAIREVRGSAGQPTCLIHGAGVLADRRIEDLTDESFAEVFFTKVTGLENLLGELAGDRLKLIVLFSSSTGRYGRIGQAAYAAANEALNKIARQQARKRADCKVVAINWGPWAGGMVMPALRKMFESEGVGVIPIKEGAEALLRELASEKSAVEVTIIARPPSAETVAVVHSTAMLHVAFEQEVNLRDHPILRSHVIDGRPVLPLALHLEWLAQAALHGNPGLAFHGVNDLRILNGVHLEEGQSQHLKVLAGQPVRHENGFLILAEIHGKRGSRDVVHSRAEVLLVSKLPMAGSAEPLAVLEPYPHPIAEVYRYFLFHGPDLAGIERIDGVSENSIAGSCRTAPLPSVWLRQPLRGNWIADPLTIDSAFQMMILWSFAQHAMGCLPCHVGRYRQYRRTFPAGPIDIRIRIKQDNGSLVHADIDFVDAGGELIARMSDHESVIDEGLNRAFRKNQPLELAGSANY